ncbi:MAG: redoxin domain-containing protein [Planctomycetes bacterium]|nr:redoxin domain-containing protein [Planctomycetota bacterium]
MRRIGRSVVTGWIVSGVAALATAAPLGGPVADLHFTDIWYQQRSLADLGKPPATVLVFVNLTCPLVRRSWPKLVRLDEAFAPRGVRIVAVDAAAGDEIAELARVGLDHGVPFPLVKDTTGALAAAVGAEFTPQAVVLDADRRIVYRGRIDDQLRLGGERPAATREDLREALEDVLAGRPVAVAETPVDGCRITRPAPAEPDRTVTFHEHVAPLLAAHCQECHRANGGAPFPLVTYDDVAGQAAAVADAVAERRMPPWYASRHEHFSNERGLSAEERRLVAAWVGAGSPAGDPAKTPPAPSPAPPWEIGTPDLVVTALGSDSLPADGFVDYRYVILPHVFLAETWIAGIEIKPSNPGTVHHCNLAYMAVGDPVDDSNFITGRVPGGTAMILDEGMGFRIPANSVLVLQIHYTTTGKPETNRMSVGLRYPRARIDRELKHLQVTTSKFEIPPGAPFHPVTAVRTLPCDAFGVGMFAHMHLRGRDMTFTALRPDADPETLLVIPNYHYAWQQNYRFTPGVKRFPKGTRVEVTAHFDNSAFNPFNPDPTVAVPYGPQTIHEMMFGFFFYVPDEPPLGLEIDPKNGRVLPSRSAAAPGAAVGPAGSGG